MYRGFINCSIYHSDAEAFLVEDERIVRTGTNEEIRSMMSDSDELIDLNGMFVVPGFNDSHLHLVGLGAYLTNLQLQGCTSVDEILAKVRKAAESAKEGEWIVGRGYNEDRFPDRQKPLRDMLDEAGGGHPVVLTRVCGHMISVNTKAMEEAGITEETEVDGGRIDYARGIIEENAIPMITNARPEPTEQQLQEYIRKGAEYCNAHGITVVGSDDFISLTENYKKVLNVYEKMSYQRKLTVRVNEQCEFNSPQEFSQFLDEGYTMDVGNDYFRIGPLKLITDGSLGARTAALSRPYADDASVSGYMCLDQETIDTYVKLANRFNMSAICHAIGDQAVQNVLDIFDENVLPGNPLHHGLVHCQIMTADQVRRVLEKKYSCYFQSQFIDYDSSILTARAGEDLAETSYPFRTLYEGTIASNGSDAPVELPDPLKGIQLACTRKSLTFDACMKESECLTVDQAIASFTEAGAKQMFMDDRAGAIKEGYLADFAVIDKDIRKIPADEIASAKVMMTVMDGNTVYER